MAGEHHGLHEGDFSSSDDDVDSSDAAGIRDLNAEEMDKLVQLQDLTGLEDLSICRALLESKNWDLEATAREHLGIPGPSANPPPPVERPPQQLPEAHNARVSRWDNQPGGGRRRGGQQNRGWMGFIIDWSYYFLTMPVMLPFQVLRAVASILDLRALMGPGGEGDGGRRGAAGRRDPAADVAEFRAAFADRYGDRERRPDFLRGSYNQALEEAKRDLRFLLVYLHSGRHQDTDAFCGETLCSDRLQDFLEENQVLLWGCSVETSEGHRVSQAMRECAYPFLAVIVLRNNKMMIVGRVEGHCSPENLVGRLEDVIR